ncbi:hypothetical protein MPLB_1700046 [Mesorhizobium sp. ORS 3324]|nr:hypothetical protein MPLB_1700046 [Mesorhizobium sp. ORS 3324]
MKQSNAIGQLVARLQLAWNAGDAAAWAANFAEDADFIHVLGGHGAGREAIAAAHSRLFETIYRKSGLQLDIEGVRQLDSAVVMRLRQNLRFHADGIEKMVTGRPSLVAVPRGEDLEIVFFQNTLEQTPAALAAHPFARADKAEPAKREANGADKSPVRSVSALGVTIEFLSRVGEHTIMEYFAPPGFHAAPPHVHARATEWFRVLSGTMRASVSGVERDVEAGGYLEVPAGTAHTWWNASTDKPLHFLFGFDRSGMDGYFERVVAIANSSPSWPPPDPAILKKLAAEYDTFDPHLPLRPKQEVGHTDAANL